MNTWIALALTAVAFDLPARSPDGKTSRVLLTRANLSQAEFQLKQFERQGPTNPEQRRFVERYGRGVMVGLLQTLVDTSQMQYSEAVRISQAVSRP